MGRVQHAKIADQQTVQFLKFQLLALGVPTSAQLTPAGLRAGGPAELYRGGAPIMDILWALRLKNVETLQRYLQEIATQITMVDLPVEARIKIASLNSLLPFFVRSSSFVAG